MSGLSLITNGWICQPRPFTKINKYITPIKIKIKQKANVYLDLEQINKIYLDLSPIKDK